MTGALGSRWRHARQFARQVWQLSRPWFASEHRWTARGLLGGIVVLNLGAVFMLVLLNDWYRLFYDALQERNAAVFWDQLVRFCWLATVYVAMAIYKFFLTQLLELRWRQWMTQHLLQRWLARHAFYQLELRRYGPQAGLDSPDNPDQRIQEDVGLFTSHTVSLCMGLLQAVVTLASFVGILWSLSGGFEFDLGGHHLAVPGFMVWMALLYCLAGSVLAHRIGRPLAVLNFSQQRLEADFRHHLVRVRDASEAIALDRGAEAEQGQLQGRFSRVLDNALQLLHAQKRLVGFTTGFGQAALVFPFVVAAPRFFSGAIQLGTLMQISSAFGRVQDALSWFVDNYDRLAAWQATTTRLLDFEASMEAQVRIQRSSGALVFEDSADQLETRGLSVALPDGRALFAGLNLRLEAGDSVVLQGPSGSGKSTLFRALAGIWPHASGLVRGPHDLVFMPQRPYLPQGRLRDALTYPGTPADSTDARLRQALFDAELPHLAKRLDEEQVWGQVLSGGEQQRLALARVLLREPRWVLADEATSALDEATEQRVYGRLLAMVRHRQGSIVSITHNPVIAALHAKAWTVSPAPDRHQAGRVSA